MTDMITDPRRTNSSSHGPDSLPGWDHPWFLTPAGSLWVVSSSSG